MSASGRTRLHRDVVAGIGCAVFGIAYVGAALRVPPDPSTASVVGPRVFPLLLGGLMVLLAVALVVGGIRGSRRPSPVETEALEAEAPVPVAAPSGGDRHGRFWVVIAILTAYVVAFIPLGYLLSTAAFLFSLGTYLSPGRLRRNALFAVIFSVVVYAMFTYGLNVPLPTGVLTGLVP